MKLIDYEHKIYHISIKNKRVIQTPEYNNLCNQMTKRIECVGVKMSGRHHLDSHDCIQDLWIVAIEAIHKYNRKRASFQTFLQMKLDQYYPWLLKQGKRPRAAERIGHFSSRISYDSNTLSSELAFIYKERLRSDTWQ
jgi:hypothetical protein